MYVCMYVCMYVRMYVCMYVCMYVYVCIYIYICIYTQLTLIVKSQGHRTDQPAHDGHPLAGGAGPQVLEPAVVRDGAALRRKHGLPSGSHALRRLRAQLRCRQGDGRRQDDALDARVPDGPRPLLRGEHPRRALPEEAPGGARAPPAFRVECRKDLNLDLLNVTTY